MGTQVFVFKSVEYKMFDGVIYSRTRSNRSWLESNANNLDVNHFWFTVTQQGQSIGCEA